MSFTFKWPRFSDQFHADAIQMLEGALNKGSKPPVIADKIEVVELEMGTQPPELEIRDIGELTMDQFRGIFRLTYEGDAHIVLRTKVQANPLNHKQPDIHMLSGSRGMLAAKDPLVVPMLLRLSHFKLDSYVVLVVSRQKGITLVFKTDPLQNVDINSTFDSIAVIQKFIQREIEGQLRQMFREDLPGIIHRLSQQWVKAKVEAPYLNKRPQAPARIRTTAASDTGVPPYGVPPRMPTVGVRPMIGRASSVANSPVYARSGSMLSSSSLGRRPASSVASFSPQDHSSSHPASHDGHADSDHFDPTYGLRPEGLPQKSVFNTFRNLFSPNKGLAELAEEESEIDEGDRSYDSGPWEELMPDSSFSMASPSDVGDLAD
ncbi:ERMES complex subunit [Phanerochaete sordida]|uniref:Mitochondrial distribution and morphology protein 34 n=1 Tax=Phanerochaete sordida TaxID=48140 RepID=A0A9P3FWS9_9APHY|nr:ERMES complex subunit [Phanerochaete sordida]